MKKESVNKFDLEAAFKALEEIEIPVVKGIKPNRENLQEKFTKKSTTEILVEDYFDVNDQSDLEAAQEEREAEIAKAKLARIEKIVDLDAESEEDLLPSYVGKFIIQCPQCMTLFYKNQEDIEKSEENPEVVNINEVCQHCGNTSGYTLIGKVDNVGEEEAENYDVEDFDENELNLDFDTEEEPVEEESTEEEPVEDETAEEGNEEELELEPIEETEEEASEEEEVKESLNENVEEEPVEETEEESEVEDVEEIPTTVEEIKEVAAEAGEEIAEVVKENPEVEAEEIKEITDEVVEDHFEVSEEAEEVVEDEEDEEVKESLTEAVDKELDDKLKAHNEYIEYLKEMIEKEEKSLANAKNDFVKKSIQSRIDALQADLEAALPEALKGEVETELPTPEEVDLNAAENKEEKDEEVKESLNESIGTKQRLVVVEPGYQYKDKDGNIYTLYGEELEEDNTGITYDWEFVDDENGDIYIFLVEALTEDANNDVKIARFGDYPAGNKKVKIAGFVDCSGSHGKDSIKNQINILKNAGATEFYYFSDKVYTTPESAWQGGRTIYSGIRDWVENNPDAKAIVTTDRDIDFNDGYKIKNHDRIEIIRVDIKESLNEEVKIISDLSDYTPWSGAVDTWNQIKDENKVNELDSMLEEIYPDGLTMTELNDILWFDSEWVLSSLGIIEEVEESLTEDTAVKPRVRHQSRREIFSRELAAHPAFEGISTRDLERYIIDLYLEDDPTAELDVEEVVEYVEDLGWGKIILDNMDKLSEGQVRHFAQKDPVFISTVKEFLGDWLIPNKSYSVGALVSELLAFLGKKPADREEAKDFKFDPNDASYKEFKDELADAYYEAKRLVPVGEALVGDVNINLDARGQSVGLLKGQGGEVHNDMTEGWFEDAYKRAEQKGFVEVKVELNPAEANKCEMVIKDDSGKNHYFTTPEWAADLEKAYSRRGKNSEQLDEFIGPAVASIAGAAGAASVANSAASVVNSLVSEDVEDTTKIRKGSKVEYLAMELAKQDFFKGISVQIIQRVLIPSYIEEFGRDSLTAEEVTKYFSDYGFGGFVLDNYFDLSLKHIKTLGKQDPRFVEALRKYCEKHSMTPDEADYEKGHFNEFEELFDLSIGTVFEANGELETIEELQDIYKALVPVTESLQESGDLDTLLDSEEFKKSISDAEVDRILAKYESLKEDVEPGLESEIAIKDIVDTWESVEEIDEESLDKLTENYLTEVYSNVKSFKTTDCSLAENKLVVEGKITFNSGKSKSTKFIYEATKTADNKLVLEGLNADFATEKAFVLNCNLDTANCLVVESLNYKYTINNTLVEGLTK